MSTEGEEIRVQLARMEGKQDVTNERLNNVQTDIVDLRRVQHMHANDIQTLKATEHQRKGAVTAIKLLWALGGSGVVGLFALVARSLAI
jgi:hypothetical protein